jgi:hypothetical protein
MELKLCMNSQVYILIFSRKNSDKIGPKFAGMFYGICVNKVDPLLEERPSKGKLSISYNHMYGTSC